MDKLTWEEIRRIHFLCDKAVGHYATEEELYQAVLDKIEREKGTSSI